MMTTFLTNIYPMREKPCIYDDYEGGAKLVGGAGDEKTGWMEACTCPCTRILLRNITRLPHITVAKHAG